MPARRASATVCARSGGKPPRRHALLRGGGAACTSSSFHPPLPSSFDSQVREGGGEPDRRGWQSPAYHAGRTTRSITSKEDAGGGRAFQAHRRAAGSVAGVPTARSSDRDRRSAGPGGLCRKAVPNRVHVDDSDGACSAAYALPGNRWRVSSCPASIRTPRDNVNVRDAQRAPKVNHPSAGVIRAG